jgi:transcriptional regulator with XRE-family HTH domain
MAKTGEKIKQLRLERGFTQTELTKKSGLHRVSLAKIEAGQRKTPDLTTCRKLAKALRVDIAFLLEGKMDAKKWNEEVDAKVKILESLLPWLKSIERNRESTWEDVVNAGRARRQIEMAILDIYSLQQVFTPQVRAPAINNVLDFKGDFCFLSLFFR